MENVTIISMHATYGLAVFLFLAAVLMNGVVRAKNTGLPPSLPLGNVSCWFYRKLDLFGVGAIAGFYYLMIILNEIVVKDMENYEVSAVDLIYNMVLQFFLAGMVTVMVVTRINPILWLGLKWKNWPWVFLIAPATVLTMWACFAGLYAIGYNNLLENLEVKQVQDTVEIFQDTKDISVLVLMSITAVIVAPICEEVVFRGYLYPVLKKFNGAWIAALVSAMIFAAAHGSMSALLPLFIFGFVLVVLYEWTGSIWTSIAAHFLFNAATVTVQLLERFGYIPEQTLK